MMMMMMMMMMIRCCAFHDAQPSLAPATTCTSTRIATTTPTPSDTT
jgi:hypothetical protein